jgi:hypothetical protein
MQPIIWVARPDKTGWNATRARDRVDYSFCVYRETDKFPARLVVRETYTDKPGARARKVVGEFVFPTAKLIKTLVTGLLSNLNDEFNYPVVNNDRNILRDRFMTKMMEFSVNESDSKYHAECIWYDDLFSDDVVRPNPGVVSASAYAVIPLLKAEEEEEVSPPATYYSAETHGWVAKSSFTNLSTDIKSLEDDVMEAMEMLEMAERIVELPPEPEFDPNDWEPGDPVPNGWIAMGDKVIQLSWPK